MTNLYRQNKERGHYVLSAVTLMIVILLVVDFTLDGHLRSRVGEYLSPVAVAFSRAAHSIGEATNFNSRTALIAENKRLQSEIELLKARMTLVDFVSQENTSLRALASLANPNAISAPVLSSFLSSPFGTFMIGVGSDDGVDTGSIVTTESGFVIGEVMEVGKNSSTALFVFAPQTETEAVVGDISLLVEGRGYTHGRARVPREVPLKVGDVVVAPRFALPIGVITRVDSSETDIYSTVFLSIPENINRVRLVRVFPSAL